MSAALTAGEQVAVTITGIVSLVGSESVYLDLPGGHVLEVPAWTQAEVARLTPADGVPLPGDVWADGSGREYWAMQLGDTTYLVDGARNERYWRSVLDGRGPLRLVYRRDPVEGVSGLDGA